MAKLLPDRLRRILAIKVPQAPAAPIARRTEFLRDMDIFQDLSALELQHISEILPMRTVRRGKVIYRQGDAVVALFLLKAGRVRLSRISSSGKRLDIAILEPHTFFGEMPLLGERMRTTEAEAFDDATLCVMSQHDIERLVLEHPRVALRMLDVLSRRLSNAEAHLEDMAYRSVQSRVSSVLLRLSASSGTHLIEGVTHENLGSMVGAYRETVTKTLNEFQASGLVHLGRRRIEVLDPAGLEALLDEDHRGKAPRSPASPH